MLKPNWFSARMLVPVAGLFVLMVLPAELVAGHFEIDRYPDGVDMVYSTGPASGVAALGAIEGHSPRFSTMGDVNGDGITEMLLCGERQTDGKVRCQVVDMIAGSVLLTTTILNEDFDLQPFAVLATDFNSDGAEELFACALNTVTGLVRCQIKNALNGNPIGAGTFTAIPGDLLILGSGSQVFRVSTFANIDGNPATAEFAICYRRQSDTQLVCRVINPLNGVLKSTVEILSPQYPNVGFFSTQIFDIDNDTKAEFITCGRNAATGLEICEIRNGQTGAVQDTVALLSPAFNVAANSTAIHFDVVSPNNEMHACGWAFGSKQPICQIYQQDGTLFRSMLVLAPSFVP